MKRSFASLLVIVLSFTLSACAATASPVGEAAPTDVGIVAPTVVSTATGVATGTPTSTTAPTATATAVSKAAPAATRSATSTAASTATSTATWAEIEPGRYLDVLVSGGQIRWFLLYIPSSYEPGKPMPLVLSFHGAGSNYREQEAMTDMTAKAEEEGFIVVYPKAAGNPPVWRLVSQQEGDVDLTFTRDLIDLLEANLSIDPARIYATGFSNGAGLANDLGCHVADRIAAIAPVAGFYAPWQDCEPGRPVPVMSFHGTADTGAPYQGMGLSIAGWAAQWAERNGCDPTPIVTFQHGAVTGETWENCDENASVTLYTIEDGVHIWPGAPLGPATQDVDATDVMWDFFQAHPMRPQSMP